MYKIFRNIGILALVLVSFLYTERIVSVVKDYDNIMIEIKQNKNQYRIDPIEATITENTIIPGVKGKEVDVEKSYAKMKKYGKFEPTLLAYTKINPQNLLKDHLDKMIRKGNSSKKMVSIIFELNNIDEIDSILKILETNNIKGNFFIDSTWIGNNEKTIIKLVKNGHIIGNLSYKGDYTNSKFMELDNIIKKIAGQKVSYCYLNEYNKQVLDICSKQGDYTIYPDIIIKNNMLVDVKKNLVSGSIISVKNINKDLDLELLIQYTKSKGMEIVNLRTLLSE